MKLFDFLSNLFLRLINKFRGIEHIEPLVTNIEPSGQEGAEEMDDTENSGSLSQSNACLIHRGWQRGCIYRLIPSVSGNRFRGLQ